MCKACLAVVGCSQFSKQAQFSSSISWHTILSCTHIIFCLQIQEEQKVIEAKIRMRQKELEEDEKREQWHDDDQDGDPPSPPAPSLPAIFPPPDLEQDSWLVWESISHPSEVSSPHPLAGC